MKSVQDTVFRAGNIVLFAAVVMSTLVLILIGEPTSYKLLQEGSVVETATALCYLACILLLVFLRPSTPLSLSWPFLLILTFMFLRELDMDKSAFTLGLLKSRQYTSDAVALSEKLFSAAILLLIITSVVILMKRYSTALIRGIRSGPSYYRSVGLGIFFTVTSKLIDGLNRKLSTFNLQVSPEAEFWAIVYEEITEFGIPLSFALAILALKHKSSLETQTAK